MSLWELENNENVFSETKKLSNKNNADQFFECAKRNEQNLFDNIRKSDFHVGLLKPSSTRSVILETPPNVCMESRNSYENKIDEISSLSESKEHPIDIQEKKDAFVNEFKGILFDKNGRSSEFLLNFYECCYEFLPRAQPQDKIGFAPIFPDICYHLTHYKPAAADIPVASDNPAHYADAIRYNARTPLQGSLLPLTRLVWA